MTPLGMPFVRILAAPFQPSVEIMRGAVVRGGGDGGPQYAPADAGQSSQVRRLDVLVVNADVANMWKGEGNDLAGIRGIGQNLLIARHRGIETNLTDGAAFGAQAPPGNNRSIGKNEARSRRSLRPGI
jgi:hypothetical protein